MPKLRAISLLSILLGAAVARAAPIPRLQGPVNDYAGVISANQRARLDAFLREQERQTSNQIVILTVNSLEGDTVQHYANEVFRAWQLGQKGKDNGVLILAAIKDRKVWIEVGKGLEGVLTDAISSQIYRNEIVPKFRTGDYGGGLWAAVSAVDKAVHGEYQAEKEATSSLAVFLMTVIVILAFVAFMRYSYYARRHAGIPWWYTGNTWGGSSGGGWLGGSGGGWSGGSGGYFGGGGSSGGGGAGGGW